MSNEEVVDRREELTRGASDLIATAKGLVSIVTREDAAAAAMFLRGVRARLRGIESHYEPIRSAVRKKMNEALSEIKRLEEADLAPWEAANTIIAGPLQAWILEDRIAAERANKASLAAAEALAKSEKTFPTLTTVIEPAKFEGIAIPVRKVGEVTDLKQLLRAVLAGKVPQAILKVDQVWLDKQATSRGKDLNFPGVVVREKPALTARGWK